MSDYNPEIVENLSYVIRLNSLHDCQHSSDPECAAATKNVRSEILDWDLSTDGTDPLYDIIIGADIVCQRSDCDGITRVLNNRLRRGGFAVFVCSSKKNRFGVDALPDVLQAAGFDVSVTSIDESTSSNILRNNQTQNSRPADELQLYQISHI